jgi:hypothetical protein
LKNGPFLKPPGIVRPEQSLLAMKEAGFRRYPVDHSGATAPEFHRLLRYTFAAISSVVIRGGDVKASPNCTW